MTLVVQRAVDTVESGGVSDSTALFGHVVRHLVSDALTHNLLIPTQTSPLFNALGLTRLLSHDASLISGHEQIVLTGFERGDDLTVLAPTEQLADLADGMARLPLTIDLLHSVADDAVGIDIDGFRRSTVAFDGFAHHFGHLPDKSIRMAIARYGRRLIKGDEPVPHRFGIRTGSHELRRGNSAGPQSRDEIGLIAPLTMFTGHPRRNLAGIETLESFIRLPGLMSSDDLVESISGMITDLLLSSAGVSEISHEHIVRRLTSPIIKLQLADGTDLVQIFLLGGTRTQKSVPRSAQNIPIGPLDRSNLIVSTELGEVLTNGSSFDVLLIISDQAIDIESRCEIVPSRIDGITQKLICLGPILFGLRGKPFRPSRTCTRIPMDEQHLTRARVFTGLRIRTDQPHRRGIIRIVRVLDRQSTAVGVFRMAALLTDETTTIGTLNGKALGHSQKVDRLRCRRGRHEVASITLEVRGIPGHDAVIVDAADITLISTTISQTHRQLRSRQLSTDLAHTTITLDLIEIGRAHV